MPDTLCWMVLTYKKKASNGPCSTAGLAITTDLVITLKAVFHFNRIVAKRSVFHCFVNTEAKLMYGHNRIRYVSIQLKWKTALTLNFYFISRCYGSV